jgi:hypothetical protein
MGLPMVGRLMLEALRPLPCHHHPLKSVTLAWTAESMCQVGLKWVALKNDKIILTIC